MPWTGCGGGGGGGGAAATMTMCFGLTVRGRGTGGVGQVCKGGGPRGRQMIPVENGLEILGERSGGGGGGDGGWPLPSHKKKKETLKGSSGWVPLFAGAYAAFSGGGALNGSSGVVAGGCGGVALLHRSPLASIRSIHTSAQGDLRQTLNSSHNNRRGTRLEP